MSLPVKRIDTNLDIKIGQQIRCVKNLTFWWSEPIEINKTYSIANIYYKEIHFVPPDNIEKYHTINKLLANSSLHYSDENKLKKYLNELTKERDNCFITLSLPFVSISIESSVYKKPYAQPHFCIIIADDLKEFIKSCEIYNNDIINFLDEYFCIKKIKRNKIFNELLNTK